MSSKEGKQRRAIPKFTSFKPTPEPEPETRPATAAREEQEAQSNKHHKHRHSHRPKESQNGHSGNPKRTLPQDRHVVPKNDIFFFDKRGDPLIVRYGGNELSKIPAYRRFWTGKVMGSDGYLVIHRDGPREQFSIRLDRDRAGAGSVFRDRSAVLLAHSNAKHIRPGTDSLATDEGDDFIALEPAKKRRRIDDEFGGEKKPDYRSIHGKAKVGEESNSEDASESEESEDEGPVEMTATKKRSIELTRQVRNHPDDIGSWLELIKLQDVLFRENEHDADVRSADAVRGLAELKLSLYEEALPHATNPADKERVLVGLMREGAKIWEPKLLAKRWDDIFKTNGESFALWRARLNFELTQMTTFTYEGLRDFIVDRLRTMNDVFSKSPTDEVLSGQLIYVFLRLTRFLHDTGYSELAVAAWQAALEMTFARPETEEQDFESALASFSDFWESEVPRIGEDGAKGWREFAESIAMVDPPEPKTNKTYEVIQTRDPFKAWAAAEQDDARKARMPARTLDEGTEDDPFRVVMFSDIKDLLVWIPAYALPQARPQMLDAFLMFCRLPTACLAQKDVVFSALLMDPFVACRGQAFESTFDKNILGGSTSSEEVARKDPEFKQQGANMALTQDVLFSGPNWFSYLGEWSRMRSLGYDDEVDSSWVLGTLKSVVRVYGVEALAEYYLALEWRNEPSAARTAARKVAKTLLKQYSSNMRLWNAYALIEWANQNLEVAEKILSSAAGQNLPGGQLLWNTWAWIHLEAGQKQPALQRLGSSVESGVVTVSPALLLKARSHFSSARDYSLSSLQLEKAVQHAESLALLEYLAAPADDSAEPASESQGNITAALSSIQGFCDELKALGTAESSVYHERLLQTAARVLYYHATHGPYRPTYLRSQLTSFNAAYPHNTIFLELLAWANQSTVLLLINDPVRDILRQQSDSGDRDDSPYLLTDSRFAIMYEAARAASAGATMTMHSTRAAFEAALDRNFNTKVNTDLWICYIAFLQSLASAAARREADRPEPKSGKQKGSGNGGSDTMMKDVQNVFYRAIAACPWSKRLYMEAFRGGLLRQMSSAELRAVVATLVGNGLRVHVEMEGFIERWKKK
ncbi:NRDE-2, necessary for RNA interference-domain-containing protein [Apodospora peruviana]|uniref:NRDE-2, necessary for RNA interference-domain-containing protein n=1 Tax=Apodospora peruviana TaxID=516989 RepID=A0AAE0LZG0_9PEZI|nr:NRDE-2, necessary for RNA interference-domain-containing protein [Apodospora peruviana]